MAVTNDERRRLLATDFLTVLFRSFGPEFYVIPADHIQHVFLGHKSLPSFNCQTHDGRPPARSGGDAGVGPAVRPVPRWRRQH
jgi:hypothetical protein